MGIWYYILTTTVLLMDAKGFEKKKLPREKHF